MKIAVLHPRKGLTGLWTPSVDASTQLAAAEVNAAGGALGAQLELFHIDCGLSRESALEAVDHVLETLQVDAIVGQHPSNVRDVIRNRVNGRVPFVYASQHEGLPDPRAAIMIGATDGELLWPAISWLIAQRKAQRFFFVGNDYIWPRVGLQTSRSLIAHEGAQFVGHALMPFEAEDFSATFSKIREARPDVVVQALVGEDTVRFNRAFAAAGLDRSVIRLGLLVDENVLCGIGQDATHDLYSVSNYFSGWKSPENMRFLDRYHGAFGRLAPPVSSTSLSCYEGIHLLAGLAGRRADPGISRMAELARRPLQRDAARHHLRGQPIGRCKTVHIARADGVAMSIVSSLTLN
ncbi:substrate-binding domain-containing protein [Marinibacterium profundimaris]|uniref:substrate-binding domain-containing protein n=1 Tax=Marinibacterium profundimaris TaxID=1679460 RepID=UPI0013036AFE|nr:substrate-binding domain-containing protein [Marinibacterium profundimaris]